jgi:hypothetical protein
MISGRGLGELLWALQRLRPRPRPRPRTLRPPVPPWSGATRTCRHYCSLHRYRLVIHPFLQRVDELCLTQAHPPPARKPKSLPAHDSGAAAITPEAADPSADPPRSPHTHLTALADNAATAPAPARYRRSSAPHARDSTNHASIPQVGNYPTPVSTSSTANSNGKRRRCRTPAQNAACSANVATASDPNHPRVARADGLKGKWSSSGAGSNGHAAAAARGGTDGKNAGKIGRRSAPQPVVKVPGKVPKKLSTAKGNVLELPRTEQEKVEEKWQCPAETSAPLPTHAPLCWDGRARVATIPPPASAKRPHVLAFPTPPRAGVSAGSHAPLSLVNPVIASGAPPPAANHAWTDSACAEAKEPCDPNRPRSGEEPRFGQDLCTPFAGVCAPCSDHAWNGQELAMTDTQVIHADECACEGHGECGPRRYTHGQPGALPGAIISRCLSVMMRRRSKTTIITQSHEWQLI